MMRNLARALLCLAVLAADARGDQTSGADEAYARMQRLSGSWHRVRQDGASEPGGFRIDYRSISRGSALVELFGDPARDLTQTIYHRDGPRLMATHYCAQGNQPRLLLAEDSTPDELHFRFLDATNLPRAGASHLVDLRFAFLPDGRLRREETYEQDGTQERSVLLLQRDRPDAAPTR